VELDGIASQETFVMVGLRVLETYVVLAPVVMAIWFGWRARRAGRGVIVWTLVGAALSFVAAMVGGTLFNVAADMMPEWFLVRLSVFALFALGLPAALAALLLRPR
jgi:hypothetical protein